MREAAGKNTTAGIARVPAFWVGSALPVMGAAACAAVPLAGRPGYESALLVAPLAGLGAGMVAASVVGRARAAGEALRFPALLWRVIASASWGPAAAFVVLVVSGAVRGFCDPVEGMGLLAAGPLGSALASAGTGLTIALAVPGRRLPIAAWIIFVVGSLAWDAWLLCTTPQVFVFDHFLGWFGGPLWDEAIGLTWRHAWFRSFTVLRLAALIVLAWALYDPVQMRILGTRARPRERTWIAAAFFAVALAGTFLAEPSAGLRTPAASVRRALGCETRTAHVTLVHPSSLTAAERRLLAAEAELDWEELEEFFGAAPGHRNTIYMFRSAGEMRALTGTGPTSVATPWLGASAMVYSRPPHPVMKHEMAHLFSATWGRGPFRTPGRLWGLLADPLVLEGVAVAADWDGDPVDPDVQAAAVVRTGIVKDPASARGLGFFGNEGGASYLLAGSFARHLWRAHGNDGLRAWYGGARFEDAFGESEASAMEAWGKHLGEVEVPGRWLDAARRGHAGGSIFERPCPHQVALTLESAGEASARGDADLAARLVEKACSIAPEDVPIAIARARYLNAIGRTPDAGLALEKAGPAEGPFAISILETRGDIAWAGGDAAAAREAWAAALDLAALDEETRTLAIKIWCIDNPGPGARILALLIGRAGKAPGEAVALLEGISSEHPGEPVVQYLLGRAQARAGKWSEAARSLEAATGAGAGALPHLVVAGEALRMLAEARLLSGDVEGAIEALDRLDAMPPPSPALRFLAKRWRALADAVEHTGNGKESRP